MRRAIPSRSVKHGLQAMASGPNPRSLTTCATPARQTPLLCQSRRSQVPQPYGPTTVASSQAKRQASSLHHSHVAATLSPHTLPRPLSTKTDPSPHITDPVIHDIFEPQTSTFQYIVADPITMKAAIVDPVLDYEPATQTITTESADGLIALALEHGYQIDWILETHAHADHLTAASYLKSRLEELQGYRPTVGIGKRIKDVQELFASRYGVPNPEWEGVFDKLFEDDEEFSIGGMKAMAMHLPGHTPDHLGYMIGENVFCGDSIFHTDIGTARCDFPGGSATSLFASGRRLLNLPETVKIWTGHDYPPNDQRKPVPYVTVGDHKKRNAHLRDGVSEEEFVEMRRARDETLGAPRLLHQSLQMNIRAGRLPEATEVGQRLLHVPLKFAAKW